METLAAAIPRQALANILDDQRGVRIEEGQVVAFAPMGVRALADMEQRHIQRVMEHCQGNKTKAAGLLGITRQTLRNKLKQYGLAELLDEQEQAGETRD